MSGETTSRVGGWRTNASVVAAVLVRPQLWPTAVRVVWRLVPMRWWARPPFLPVPSRSYMRFRKEAQYGDSQTPFRPADVLNYLMWVRTWRS